LRRTCFGFLLLIVVAVFVLYVVVDNVFVGGAWYSNSNPILEEEEDGVGEPPKSKDGI
jgi:hypothetical protein